VCTSFVSFAPNHPVQWRHQISSVVGDKVFDVFRAGGGALSLIHARSVQCLNCRRHKVFGGKTLGAVPDENV